MGKEKKEYEMVSDVQPKNWKLPFAVGGVIQFKNSVFDVQNLRNINRHGEMLCKIKQMSIEELKSPLMRVKEESEKAGLKLNI